VLGESASQSISQLPLKQSSAQFVQGKKFGERKQSLDHSIRVRLRNTFTQPFRPSCKSSQFHLDNSLSL
jgi:hypothetical protein